MLHLKHVRVAAGMLLLGALFACGGSSMNASGTDTDNPNLPISADSGAAIPPIEEYRASMTALITLSFTSKLESCFPEVANYDLLAREINLSSSFAEPLGLDPADYPDFFAITSKEISGDLVGDSSLTTLCTTPIDQLACDDPALLTAYDPGAPTDISRLSTLLSDEACAAIFRN